MENNKILNKYSDHHPFCNLFMNSRIGCKQCEVLYQHYPINENEFSNEAYNRLVDENFTKVKIIK